MVSWPVCLSRNIFTCHAPVHLLGLRLWQRHSGDAAQHWQMVTASNVSCLGGQDSHANSLTIQLLELSVHHHIVQYALLHCAGLLARAVRADVCVGWCSGLRLVPAIHRHHSTVAQIPSLGMQWPGALGVLCVLGSPYMPITSSLRLAEPTLAFRSPMISLTAQLDSLTA
jgi:hypothetical protein